MEIAEKTRKVYHKQHGRIVNDDVAMSRFLNMIQEEYFQLPKDYFKGKRILDAGCGDTAKIIIRLSQFGCTDLVGVDLGEDFIPVAKQNIAKHGVPETSVQFKSGSVTKLPFGDEEFDFVVCHGVMVHLENFDKVEQAFSELARVTKKGGYLYTVYGLYGGLLEKIYPAIRDYYNTNNEFREFVDGISPETFSDLFSFIEEKAEQRGEYVRFNSIKELFDTDLCVTIQNVIQAPVRLQISPDFVESKYSEHGFEEPKKLKRYVHRKNIRKLFAPLHYHRDHMISRILYGTGNLEYLGRKSFD